MEPDIIVLDEPTTGQDRGHLNKFLAQMKMLNETGKTIILISHDMGVVAEYTSRTIVMKDGGNPAGRWHPCFSRPDIFGEASIEPHLLARACNDVRKEGVRFYIRVEPQPCHPILKYGASAGAVGWAFR